MPVNGPRPALVATALFLLAAGPWPGAVATEPYSTLVEWETGRFDVGIPIPLPEAAPAGPRNSRTFAFTTDSCHPHLLLDLLFEPDHVTVAGPGVETSAPFAFRVAVLDASGLRVVSREVTRSGHGTPLGDIPGGAWTLELTLARGVDVDWSLRLRAREVIGDPACGTGPL